MADSWTSILDDLCAAAHDAPEELKPRLRLHLGRARAQAESEHRRAAAQRQNIERHRVLLERTTRLAMSQGVEPVAEEILAGMLAVVGATRGFVGLTHPDGSWELLVARALDGRAIPDPGHKVSKTIIEATLAATSPTVLGDASHAFGSTSGPSIHRLHLRSVACVPIRRDDRTLGFVYLDNPDATGLFDAPALEVLEAWAPVVAAVLSRELDAPSAVKTAFPAIVTRSRVLLDVLEELARVAPYGVPILLFGEPGTGRSLVARQVHDASRRAAGPFLHVHCGVLGRDRARRELFGHEKGAFPGAVSDSAGKLEAARGGTLFLDDLDALPLDVQVLLLRAIQEGVFTRFGDDRPIETDVRIIAATTSDPSELVAAGRLRGDLVFKLGVIVARLPPLRERTADIPLLALHLLQQAVERHHLPHRALGSRALRALLEHSWPGNVRELENALDRAALLATGPTIDTVATLAAFDSSGGSGRRTPPRGLQGPIVRLGEATPRTRRSRVSRAEFIEARDASEGSMKRLADILGVHVRSAWRLKAKYAPDAATES